MKWFTSTSSYVRLTPRITELNALLESPLSHLNR